jgi:hypothetical protein
MSRAYNARRKARRQAKASAEPAHSRRPISFRRRLPVLVPVLLIAAILSVVGVLGFGASSGAGKEQVAQEVTELLDGIPQKGTVLGSPKAPITVFVHADLQCPTVKLFVENYLPSIIETWVRSGVIRLAYRSLETDALNEEIFFEQERAALAAGRQSTMWNFVLTFVRQQGEVRTDYVTEEFMTDVALQVPRLEVARWRRDRNDALLSKQVALGVQSGHARGLHSTPGFLIGFTAGEAGRVKGRAALRKEVEASLGAQIEALDREAFADDPTIKTIGPSVVGG